MELEELKRNWAALNERIDNVEMVNERLVKGMIELRTQSIFGRIFDQQRSSQNLGLLFILCCSIRYLFKYFRGEETSPYILIIACLPLIYAICKRTVYLPLYAKIDIAKVTPQKALKNLLLYKRLYLLEHYSAYIIGILGTIAFVIWYIIFTYNTYNKYHLKTDIQIFLLVLSVEIIAMTFMIWKGIKFKQKHLKDLKELEDGLQELKEYEE